jgi:hypothetical protein
MANDNVPHTTSGPANAPPVDRNRSQPGQSSPITEHAPDPLQLEEKQPDPMLQVSAGRVSAGGITLLALVVAAILGVVFFGAQAPAHSTQPAAGGQSAPPTPGASQTTPKG